MAHRAGIDQLQHEQRLVLGRLGVGLDRQRDLEGLGVELAVGDLDVERELRLGLLDQALRRARVLEAQVLDVLAVHDQRRVGRLLGGGAQRALRVLRRRRDVGHGYFLCCGRAVPRRAALHKPRAGAAGCHLQSPRPNKRIAGTFLHASARDNGSLFSASPRGSHGLLQGKRPRRLASHGWRQVCPGSHPCRRRPARLDPGDWSRAGGRRTIDHRGARPPARHAGRRAADRQPVQCRAASLRRRAEPGRHRARSGARRHHAAP